MATTLIDNDLLKEALNKLIQQDPITFQSIIKEVIEKNRPTSDHEFEAALMESFTRFEKTYKALA